MSEAMKHAQSEEERNEIAAKLAEMKKVSEQKSPPLRFRLVAELPIWFRIALALPPKGKVPRQKNFFHQFFAK